MHSANKPQTRHVQWKSTIVIAMLVGALIGCLVSHLLSPKYISRSLLLSVRPINADVWEVPSLAYRQQRLKAYQQELLAGPHLLSIVERMGVAKSGGEAELLEKIRGNTTFEPVSNDGEFYVVYVDSAPERAQLICNGLTTLLLDDQARKRRESQDSAFKFLIGQLEDAKKT